MVLISFYSLLSRFQTCTSVQDLSRFVYVQYVHISSYGSGHFLGTPATKTSYWRIQQENRWKIHSEQVKCRVNNAADLLCLLHALPRHHRMFQKLVNLCVRQGQSHPSNGKCYLQKMSRPNPTFSRVHVWKRYCSVFQV